MAGQNQAVNMDQFEAYFKRADLDGDGRISGAEAVAFFQGSSLSKQVLAQIWMHADQSHTGFLSRQEFYNALKLVTVAQSRRDLTPDIVKAALYGPASAKIPAPQISLPATSSSQLSSMGSASVPRTGSVAPSQNIGFQGQGAPNPGMNQGYFSQQNQSARPSQPMATIASVPPLGTSSLDISKSGNIVTFGSKHSSNMSNDWLSGRTSGVQIGPRGTSAPLSSVASRPPSQFSMSPQSTTNDSKAPVASGNASASDSVLGGGSFSGNPALQKPEPSMPNYPVGSAPTSSGILPVSSGTQASSRSNSLDSLQSNFLLQSSRGQVRQASPSLSQSLQVSAQGPSPLVSSGLSAAVGNPSSDNSKIPWPKMKTSDVQKYAKVFMEVDTDRDGRITGEQARNLFLSWRLPREVLKQVWDLSDQDSDSMLSLREFCFALYLMERYREGRPLPAALPSTIIYDETLLSMTGQPRVAYGNVAWGFGQQQQQGMPVAQPAASVPGLRPSMEVKAPKSDSSSKSDQQKSSAPVLEDSFLDPLQNGDKTSVNAKSEDERTVKQAAETEKIILDSKEKIEFYRTMMQELVLYKSRCDNRLNEITERALADKREAESLAKKYEEKYKQVAEIASKLTVQEATFREIQERKTELHQALVKVEQGGSADGILQVRADRLQSHLEELTKALTELCKKHKIDVKSTALIELPIGWQPGIQEGAAVWNEDWDKFEDEGFASEITVDGKIVSVASNPKSANVQGDKDPRDGSISPDSSIFAEGKPGNIFSSAEYAMGDEFTNVHDDDELGRNTHDSPARRAAFDSPPREFPDVRTEKTTDADSETHGSFDEPAWGAFDNDDIDSVWGFNANKDFGKHEDLFGHGGFSVNPIQTGSPGADSVYQRRSPFFEDSVPSTPMSKFGSPRYSEADHFDKFSRFDSFSTHDGGFSQQPERLTRFDSVNSTKDFGRGLSRFDSIGSSRELVHEPAHTRFDSVGSTIDFGQNQAFTRFDSMNSSRDFGQNPALTRFDSTNSTKDFASHAYSFDDSDPFGSAGPFKASSGNQNSKKNSENWGSF